MHTFMFAAGWFACGMNCLIHGWSTAAWAASGLFLVALMSAIEFMAWRDTSREREEESGEGDDNRGE